MLAVTHTLTSAAIGVHTPSAPLAFGLAFVFHLFSDTLLHWNIYVEKHRWPYFWTAVDVIAGLALAYLLLPDRFFTAPLLAAVVGGNLIDVYAGIVTLSRWPKDRFLKFHAGLQQETDSPVRGLLWQIVLVAASLWLLRP